MKKLFSLFIILISVLSNLQAQTPDNDNFVVTHGPWLQNLDQTGVTIMWTTNKPAVPGIMLTLPDGTQKLVRNSTDGIINAGGTLQKVRIDGLQPGTSYKYSLHSVQIMKYQAYKVYYGDTLVRKAETFVTPSPAAEKVAFTIYNDVHELSGKIGTYFRLRSTAEQDFYFLNGDLVDYLQNTDQLFPGFIDTAVYYFAAKKPFYYSRGNHETRGYLARELKDYFDYPNNRFYNSFDVGPVHFVVLDCGEDKPDNNRYYYGLADYDRYRQEELEWLKNEIKSAAFKNAKYRIVLVHIPIIKQEKQGWGAAFLAENFGPVLKDARIDLMISAHTHRYALYGKDKTGFNYPLLVNSNNSFVEVLADQSGIKATVKDLTGKVLGEYKSASTH